MARCAEEGAEEGAGLETPREDVGGEDWVGVGLVFGVGGVGEVVCWDGHGWQGRWSGFGKGD